MTPRDARVRSLPVSLAGALAALLLLAACGTDAGDSGSLGPAPTDPQPDTISASPDPTESAAPEGPTRPRVVRTVARGLEVPWGVSFLPDGSALVSERDSTRVLAVDEDGTVREVGTVSDAAPRGEAGLLGLAASPSYDEDGWVYAYVSTASDNRVVRMQYDGERIGEPEPLLTGIPNGFIHDGGRLLFGPDGFLYVSTGEIGEPGLAQDPDSLAGKILRLTPEGEPAGVREGSPVWSMGHRNVQGLAFDDDGTLWATEFGQSTADELNLIRSGANYGWPLVEGEGDLAEFRNPHVTWATSESSPSGLAYLEGTLWSAALRGQRLWQVPVDGDRTGRPRDWFVGDYGRLRTVTVTPQGTLWVTTSNRDGRGEPAEADDRILEIEVPAVE